MSDFKDRLKQQLDELEVLQSVFSGVGEIEVEDNDAYYSIVAFTRDIDPTIPVARLSYRMQLVATGSADASTRDDAPTKRHNLAVVVRLPHGYPDALPEVYVTSDKLNRNANDVLNSNLKEYMNETVVPGEVCMLSLVDWIREKASCIVAECPPTVGGGTRSVPPTQDRQAHFCRMWLYMHHIYSKTKRRDILSLSSELKLSGFCLPGKPGVVCVEGEEEAVERFYCALKRWSWKSIACARKDVIPSSDSTGTVESYRKIQGFQELVMGTHTNHADMGQFLEYLRAHELDYVFKDLFGVEGQAKTA